MTRPVEVSADESVLGSERGRASVDGTGQQRRLLWTLAFIVVLTAAYVIINRWSAINALAKSLGRMLWG